MLAAQQYFIEYGKTVDVQRLQSLLPSYVPESCLQKSSSLHMWMNAVINKLKSSYFQDLRVEPLKVENVYSIS